MANLPYAISKRTNPSALYELLFGVSKVSAGKKEFTSELLIQRLVNDFRHEIEDKLPVFYLIDCEEVFNTLLDEINPNNATISKYLDSIGGSSVDFVEIYGDIYLPFKYIDKRTKSFRELYEEAYINIVKNKNTHIRKLNSELRSKQKPVKIEDISNKLNDVIEYINSTIADFVDVGVPQAEISKATKISSAKEAGEIMKKAFAGSGKTYISDAENLVSNFKNDTMTLIVAQSYSLATRDNHNILTDVIKNIIFKNIEVSFNQNFPETKESFNVNEVIDINFNNDFKIGLLVAAGHAAVRSSNKGIIGINTPLFQIAAAILQANNKPIPGLQKAFIDQAGHTPYAIEINENYSNTAKNFINIQISFLRSQRAAINSGQISTAEIKFFDSIFLKYLNKSYRDVREQYIKKLNSNKVLTFFTDTFSLSPTFKQHVQNLIVASIVDDKSYKGSKGSLNNQVANSIKNTSLKVKNQGKSVSKIQPKVVKSASTYVKRKQKAATFIEKSFIDLQTIINSLLSQKIRENMGDGSRRDILNYRTGRFANSVNVQRITQGREGMLTAYYTYMKNPYATFSEGGRQEFPRSRDPKLLISKSIREIAQERAITRLRAVLV